MRLRAALAQAAATLESLAPKPLAIVSEAAIQNARWLCDAMEAMRERRPGTMTATECAVVLDYIEKTIDAEMLSDLRQTVTVQRNEMRGLRRRLVAAEEVAANVVHDIHAGVTNCPCCDYPQAQDEHDRGCALRAWLQTQP